MYGMVWTDTDGEETFYLEIAVICSACFCQSGDWDDDSEQRNDYFQNDCAGNVLVVYDGSSDYMLTRRLWLLEIRTVKHCEEQYHSYILGGEKSLNSKMLYFTKDSMMNSSNNIIEMMRMHDEYAM